MKYIAIFFSILFGGFFISGGVAIYIMAKNEEPPKSYKYTIWTGSPSFGVGHDTDTFNINKGMITYIDRLGKEKMHPLTSVYEVEKN